MFKGGEEILKLDGTRIKADNKESSYSEVQRRETRKEKVPKPN